MPSILDDDDDRDMAGSQDGSSDNDMDETMRDVDDIEAEPEAEPGSPSNSSLMDLENQARRNTQNPEVLLTEASPVDQTLGSSISYRPTIRPDALTASTYDIIPTTAAPHSTSINAVTATADMRWVYTGGSDGYVRKFNWAESINGKLMLTVAQRHPFVDSVVKAGVLMNYWENMDGNTLSPVYSLAAQAEGLWLLSGLESGSIRLQSVRHDEGKEIAVLRQHTSAVSSLCLTQDERSLLSGSWDKRVLEWDLDTGKVKRTFGSNIGQISALEIRPESNLPVPRELVERALTNGTYSSNTQAPANQSFINGEEPNSKDTTDQPAASPADSLFEADSLFGDGDNGGDPDAPSGGAFAAEDDEFSQALPNGIGQASAVIEPGSETNPPYTQSDQVTIPNTDSQHGNTTSETNPMTQSHSTPKAHEMNSVSDLSSGTLPHAEDLESSTATLEKSMISQEYDSNVTSNTTFLSASIDGTIRIWDRRQPDPIARISPRHSPPWCMNACWSPDGNYIYAGRRNGTVEEYSLHHGLRDPERIFKFPHGSGAVTALKAMPNGRHLICASHDILRLYDLQGDHLSKSAVPFLIVPGHRTGSVSQLYIDAACKYMISTGGNRGWEGATTEVLLGYEISNP
ncbi:Transcription factor spt8 [Myotisia sp. PD_48]|nr:Transcription factor spt8 [Myotisia sp. PD_48]